MVLEQLRRLQLGRLGLSPALQELPSDTCCVRSFKDKTLVGLECLKCSNAKEDESEETNVSRSTSKRVTMKTAAWRVEDKKDSQF